MSLLSRVIEQLDSGSNVLLHGPGGCGKSYTICHVAKHYRDMFSLPDANGASLKRIMVTALTGVAAVVLSQSGAKARTLHSWSGIGLGDKSADTLIKLIQSDPKKSGRWKAVSILVIDEISMLGAELFDKLDLIAKAIRCDDRPFGGIQLLMSGDFLQNPPIKAEFVFMSETWAQLPITWVELSIPKRYSDEKWFERLLRFRKAQHTAEDWEFLKERHQAWNAVLKECERSKKAMVKPTVLKSKKIDVSAENMTELEKLKEEPHEYKSTYSFHEKKGGRVNREYVVKLFEEQIQPIVVLKVGAQVMLKFNLDVDLELVNGSRGVITQIQPVGVEVLWVSGKKTWVGQNTWELEDDDGIYSCTQIPLVLAWSMTIHKSQASTLDCVALDLSDLFNCGQGYVGLSRVRNGEGLYITGLVSGKKITASKIALDFLASVEEVENPGVIAEF